jgi:tetratricopeptide (TPR) repeat protein
MALEIPVRYSITQFIKASTSDFLFQSLQKRFLLEKKNNILYEVPEFVRSHVQRQYEISETKQIHHIAIEYLKSISNGLHVFESIALINHAIKANHQDIALKEARKLVSSLMGMGQFNLVLRIASDLEKDQLTERWDFIYYIQGRVLRFQERYSESLGKYEKALNLIEDGELRNVLQFEKASLLSLLSEETDGDSYLNEAVRIYEELEKLQIRDISIQSQSVLAQISMKKGDIVGCIEKMEEVISGVNIDGTSSNVIASLWQLLGDAHSTNSEYQKAIECYDKSFGYYEEAVKTFGMNTIDGLFHLYQSLGWTYSMAEMDEEAMKIFHIAISLCFHFGLTAKLQKTLFDYGYRLILIERFEEACAALSEHHDLLKENQISDDEVDSRLVYGTLTFAYWYNEQYIEAVELLAVYILACASYGHKAAVSVLEEKSLEEDIDIKSYFKKHIYLLVIPAGKTFEDFYSWLKIVSQKRPDLKDVLNSFSFLRKG